MSKYDALGGYLRRQHRELVPMTFGEIEKITGVKLPASARKHRPWWSNNPQNSVMTRVWLDAGFKSEQVDLAGRKLLFRRVRGQNQPVKAATQGDEKPFHPLYGVMKGLLRVMPGINLTQPADPEWAERLDSEYGKDGRDA